MKETYGLNIYGIKILTEAEGGLCGPIGMIHRVTPMFSWGWKETSFHLMLYLQTHHRFYNHLKSSW